jgi:hypothetical protein
MSDRREAAIAHARRALASRKQLPAPWSARPECWFFLASYDAKELYSEDLRHDTLYGTVRVIHPFVRCSCPRTGPLASMPWRPGT